MRRGTDGGPEAALPAVAVPSLSRRGPREGGPSAPESAVAAACALRGAGEAGRTVVRGVHCTLRRWGRCSILRRVQGEFFQELLQFICLLVFFKRSFWESGGRIEQCFCSHRRSGDCGPGRQL